MVYLINYHSYSHQLLQAFTDQITPDYIVSSFTSNFHISSCFQNQLLHEIMVIYIKHYSSFCIVNINNSSCSNSFIEVFSAQKKYHNQIYFVYLHQLLQQLARWIFLDMNTEKSGD